MLFDDIWREVADHVGDDRAGMLFTNVKSLGEDDVPEWGTDFGDSYEEIVAAVEGILDNPEWARESLELFIDNVEGNSWVPMRAIVEGDYAAADRALGQAAGPGLGEGALLDQREWSRGQLLYEMVRVIDRDLGELSSLDKMGLGLTAPWSTMAQLRPEDVRVLRLAARASARVDPVPEELELRFSPEDLALSPVTYGRR